MSAAWKLIIEDDAGKQIVVPFTRDVITIGRKEGNTIRLTERNVSRFHAKLAKENGHVLVEDLGSFNGIRLNGDRISGKVSVNEGDTIQIGDYHLALHAQAAAGTVKNGAAPAAGPGHKSSALQGQAPQADDDEFAGDTQRWEPPGDMAPMAVGQMQTQEEIRRAPISEDTARAPITGVSSLDVTQEGFAQDPAAQATERFNTAPGVAGAPISVEAAPVRKFSGNLEPTVKQAVASPAPVSGVGAPPRPAVGPMLTPGAESPFETRPERPMPGPAGGPASTPSAIARPPTSGSKGPGEGAAVGPGSPAAPFSSGPSSAIPAPTIPMASVPTAALPSATQPSPTHAAATLPPTEQTEAMRPAPTAGEDVSVPRLFVVNTIFCGSAFRLSAPEAVIGRTEDNDITIEHRSVSRNHAKVVREGDRVRILDLKSANGILVNGEEIEAAVLRNGDIVELGRVRLRFVPIGERFNVTPDEIERARIADTVGDEFEGEGATGITNPVRSRTMPGQPDSPAARNNMVLYAAIAGLVVVGGIAAALVFGGSAKEEDEDPKPDVVARGDTQPVVGPVAVRGKPTDPAPVDDATKPRPDATQPVAADSARDDGAKPGGVQPVDAQPDGAQPDGAQPDGAQPDGAQPDGTQPDTQADAADPPDGSEPRTPRTRRGRRKMSAEDADAKIKAATASFFKGDKARCLTQLSDVLRDYPSNADAKRVQGLCSK